MDIVSTVNPVPTASRSTSRDDSPSTSTATGAVVRMEKNGAVHVLADRYEGKRLNSPNDLVYKSDARSISPILLSDCPNL